MSWSVLGNFVMLDASLWAYESMWLHLPPLRENTSVIQGWGMTLGCFTWIMHGDLARPSGPIVGSGDPPMVGPQAQISPACNVLHTNT